MRLLFLTIFCCSLQSLHAQTFNAPELYFFVISGNEESVKEFFLKNGLSLLPVDKVKGSETSPMYASMGPEHWFNKKGEQILFEFKSQTHKVSASFDWNPEKKQIENISMIRPRVDSLTFEKQMVMLNMINAERTRYSSIFVSNDYELVILREPAALDPDSEIFMIFRRDSRMAQYLPQLPKKFNKKKK